MRTGRARVAVLLALSACACALPARAGSQEAFEAMKAGRYLEAAAELQAVVDRSPGYADGYFLLGHCMLKMGRIREAELDFRRAIRLDPTSAAYYDGLAFALAAGGDWSHVVRALTEGLGRTEDPRVRHSFLGFRGYAFSSLRRWDEAIADFEAAARIRNEPWILAFLGRARFAKGAYADALVPLLQVLNVAPDDRVMLRLVAESYLRLAVAEPRVRKKFNYLKAYEFAQRLAAVAPHDLGAANLVGRAALGAGRLDQAEHVFKHVVSINPRHCYALANLGRTYMSSGRLAEAEAYLRSASACAPRMTAIWESLGELYLAVGKPQEAAAAYRRIEEIEPSQTASDLPATIPVFRPR